jgi:hypothetical protein
MTTSKPSPFYQFLTVFFSVFATGSLLVIGFNLLVDPYSNFHSIKIKHLNEVRNVTDVLVSDCRFYRSLQISHLKPKVIFLGSSRIMAGINPENLIHMIGEKSIYNAGFHGARFDEIYDFFNHALHFQPELKKVFIGIDFFAFQTSKKKNQEQLYTIKASHYSLNNLQICLFSKKGVIASYKTVLENFFNDPMPYLIENGHQPSGNIKELNPILQMGEATYLKKLYAMRKKNSSL